MPSDVLHSSDALLAEANAAHRGGRLDHAVALYRALLAQDPLHPDALGNLAGVLNRQSRFDEAEVLCRRAIAAQPRALSAWSNLAGSLLERQRCDEAIHACRTTLGIDGNNREALNNLGVAYYLSQRPAQAVPVLSLASRLAPDNPGTRCNHALALLQAGDLPRGFAEYEWRWQTPSMIPHGLSVPQWRGEALAGRTILLHEEGGFGDVLQFVRWAPLVAARGGRVILRVHPPLVRLLQRLPGVAAVLPQGAALPPYDLHCPILSLPLAFGTTLATIPGTPFLSADPADAARWASRMGQRTGLRVGLVWAGAPRPELREAHLADARRSTRLDSFAPLAGIPNVTFHSLQKGDPAREAATPPAGMTLTDLTPDLRDFADTAALVAQLDLIVTVDTAVAHLAAGMGKPVWMLSRFDQCWRWLTGRDDTPWYPSMSLYRQPRPFDWETPMARLAEDLRGVAARATASWPRTTE